MQFKGILKDCIKTFKGGFILSFETNQCNLSSEDINSLKMAKNGLKIDVREFRERRSINANNYFHLLVHKIAEVLKIGNDECKIKMNLEYGTPKRIDENTLFAFKVPKGVLVNDIVEYPKWVKEVEDNGQICDVYIVYKETHTLDTKEMSKLIDGVIYEAQQLDIETITENEKRNMLSLWGVYETKE